MRQRFLRPAGSHGRPQVHFRAGSLAAATALTRVGSAAAPESKAGQAFAVRECYCPAHFGNSCEALWPREMAAYLAEAAWWGFNRYGDWITTTDVCNPYTSDAFWAQQEELQRGVYRLGPVRHVFTPKFAPPRWYDSWQKATRRLPKSQGMQREA